MMTSWIGRNSISQRSRDSPVFPIAEDEAVPYSQEDASLFVSEVTAHNVGLHKLDSEDFDASGEQSMNKFAKSVEPLIKSLTELEQSHPFIATAPLSQSFITAINLIFSGRGIDKKVMPILIQIRKLMSAFADLQYILNSQRSGPDGRTIGERLKSLMGEVADDIKLFAVTYDWYMRQNSLKQILKARAFETRLSETAMQFVEHQQALQLVLSTHIALGIDSAVSPQPSPHLRIQNIHGLAPSSPTPRQPVFPHPYHPTKDVHRDNFTTSRPLTPGDGTSIGDLIPPSTPQVTVTTNTTSDVTAYPPPEFPDTVNYRTGNQRPVDSSSPIINTGRTADGLTESMTSGQQHRVQLIIEYLTNIFRDVQLYRQLLRHKDKEAQMILDVFQMLLDMPNLVAEFRSNLLVAMQRLSKTAAVYPASYLLQNVKLESDDPVAAGGFADIYKGRFDGKVVCLKVIRLYQSSQGDAFLKQLCMEAILWSQLSHPNLLPVYGLCRYGTRVCLVSPWMEYGDVADFLSQHPSECRTLLVIDVASGVNYLHAHDIIHGDLKGANILVDSSRRACITDFGLSGVSDTNVLHWPSQSSAASKGGSIRWQAPELFNFESETTAHNSKPSDVYAFACVAYEIYTDTVPFSDITRDGAVMLKVRSGNRPSKPDASSNVWNSGPRGLTESIWSLMEACWVEDPRARPSITEAYGILIEEGRPVHDGRPPVDVESMSARHLRDGVYARGELSASITTVLDRLRSS